MTSADLKGRLQDEPLPLLLHHLHHDQATGVLHVEARLGRHEVYLREGFPVSVSLPGSAELLGKVLVEMGILDEETHRRTLATPPPTGTRYGAWLVEQKLVTQEHLRLALKAQVRRKLHRLFFLNEGQFTFQPGAHEEGMEHHEPLRVHPARAIYQGVRSAWSAERLRQALFLLEGRAISCRLEADAIARYGIGPEDGRVAELLRQGFFTLADLVTASGLPIQPVHALVYALYVTDALEIRGADEVARLRPRTASGASPLPAPPPAPPSSASLAQQVADKAKVVESENLFAVLGLAATASGEQVKQAYFEAAKRYHPDRISSLGLEPLRGDVEKIFRRVSEAYATLASDVQREAYRKQLAKPGESATPEAHAQAMTLLEAELAFKRGEVFLRKNDLPAAIRELEQAVAGSPQEGEHLAWLTWARVCANQLSYADAKPRFVEATRLSPRCARAYHFLGLCWKEEKDMERAYAMFNKAHELDARLLDAEREMRLINMRREKSQTKGGLFDRFRKK